MNESKLPKKLSTGILLALVDLAAAEANPNYRVYMGTWHSPDEEGRCTVCFAGSVIAGSLCTPPDESTGPDEFPDSIREKLYALDAIRTGEVAHAARLWFDNNTPLDDELVELRGNVAVSDYHDDRAEWKRDMRRIAKALAKLGL